MVNNVKSHSELINICDGLKYNVNFHIFHPYLIKSFVKLKKSEKVAVLSKWSFVSRRITVKQQFTSVNWQFTVKQWFTVKQRFTVKWQFTVKQQFISVKWQFTSVKQQFTSVKQQFTSVKWWFTLVNWWFTAVKYLISGLQLSFYRWVETHIPIFLLHKHFDMSKKLHLNTIQTIELHISFQLYQKYLFESTVLFTQYILTPVNPLNTIYQIIYFNILWVCWLLVYTCKPLLYTKKLKERCYLYNVQHL